MMKQAYRILPSAVLLLLAALVSPAGCTSFAPGADPVLVSAQRTEKVANDAIDGFLQAEYESKDLVFKHAPDVDLFARQLGPAAKKAIADYHAAEDAYKASKTTANADKMSAAAAALAMLASDAQNYLARMATASTKGP